MEFENCQVCYKVAKTTNTKKYGTCRKCFELQKMICPDCGKVYKNSQTIFNYNNKRKHYNPHEICDSCEYQMMI